MRRGNLLEAAGILLESEDRQHRAVRNLLLEIGPQLGEQARQAYSDGEVAVAKELITCAHKCTPLAPEHEVLRDRILRDCEERSKQREWRDGHIRQAAAWAEQGRLCSAIAMIRPLEDDPEAARRRLDWQEKLDRLQRYVREFEEFLQRDELAAAEAVLRKARQVGRTNPQVLCMEKAWRRSTSHAGGDGQTQENSGGAGLVPPSCPPAPIDDRGKVFGLDGLSIGAVLVVPQPVVLVGTASVDWVQLPMAAPLHRQHALILREPNHGDRMSRYRVLPFAGCAVSIGGAVVDDSLTLTDGDVIRFGSDQCQWMFRRPMPNSDTAILERRVGASGCVCTHDETEFSVVVLLGDRFAVGSEDAAADGDCHLGEPALPARRFCLEWKKQGLGAAVEWMENGGALYGNSGDREFDPVKETMLVPCELALYAELLGWDIVHDTGPDHLRLRVWDPNRVKEESLDGQ